MEFIRPVLIIAGLVFILLAALKKDFTQVSSGWLGVFIIGIAELVQLVVK